MRSSPEDKSTEEVRCVCGDHGHHVGGGVQGRDLQS